MADWSALVKGFQGGSDWAQDFRARRQFEKARDQALERGERDLYATRGAQQDTMELFPEETAGMKPFSYERLEDPFAFKLFDWAKSKMSRKGKKRKAIDLGGESTFGSSNPVGTGEEEYAAETYAMPEEEPVESEEFADGGDIMAAMEAARGQTQAFASQASAAPQTTVQAAGAQPVPSATGVLDTGRGFADGGSADEVRDRSKASAREIARGTDRSAEVHRGPARRALDVTLDRNNITKRPGAANLGRRALTGASRLAGRAPIIGALGATALEAFDTPTEDYRERFGLETDDPSLLGDVGVRTLGAASDLGNLLTYGAAGKLLYRDKQRQEAEAGAAPQQALPVDQGGGPTQLPDITMGQASQGASVQRAALPSSSATDPEMMDFGDIDIDAKEVPDMKTDDWKKYRAAVIRDAARRGQPIDQVNNRITEMQQKGFLNYGQQGLALQQAGNIRGAMAAYRAAFQYFPNGNDVEFGTSRNKRTGREQIIGFGKDEKTGKVVPGSELIMDPERVGVLLENFKRPEAFRMWTKDWRDFKEGQRKYEEVTKPLAQAQADSLANNSEARILAAENAALRAGGQGGAGGAANLRNAERVFRERLGGMGLQDEAQADYLASVMSQVKVANPNVPDNTIVQVIMTAAKDGTLEQRLQRMGVGGASPSSPAPSPAMQALPTGGGEQDYNNPPPGVDPQAWFSPEMQGLSYDERVMASTPAR